MKLLISVIAFLAVCAGAFAQRMDGAVVKFSNVTTGETATVETSEFQYNGYVERLSLKFATNHTVNIKVSAYNEYSDMTNTIYEGTGVGTNMTIYPRVSPHNTSGDSLASSNEYIRIPLIQDKIRYEVWSASDTNQTLTILFYYQGM